MGGNDIRSAYLKFFERKGHKVIKPSPIVLKDDSTTLFTSAGMQPLVPNLLGKKHKDGDKLVDSQPCFRSQDIEEVGDNRHDTLFEMLGNWGLGSYFKKEQIPWLWEFLTKELNLPKERLFVTVFEGNNEIPKDTESFELWKSLGVPENHIYFYGDKKNWWSRAGVPSNMPAGEPGGPSSEVFFEFENIKHDKKFGEECHPNCDCGRFMEIANSVFVQYKKEKDGSLSELSQKNVDFGGGLERLAAAVNSNADIFKTDLFWPVIQEIEKLSGKKYENHEGTMRVVTDHLKAAIFLIKDEITPSNKMHGYVLRRLLRRIATKAYLMDKNFGSSDDFKSLFKIIIETYKIYLSNIDIEKTWTIISEEIRKFRVNLEKGLNKIKKTDDINEMFAFDLMQSEGFPFEITQELAKEKGVELDKDKFQELLTKHQELSRKTSEKTFGIK